LGAAAGSGHVLLCACPAHRNLVCAPAGLAWAQGQTRAAGAFSGGLFFSAQGMWGQGASAADTSLRQPSSCAPLPSEPVVWVGALWPLGPACSLWLLLLPGPSSSSWCPLPKAQTQGDLQVLGLWVRCPGGALVAGLFWLCLCSQLALGPGCALSPVL